eukprot:gb/GECG01014192.1/.p1 GENE.gb/GECG01014192.1/~~gb/GECG01014192.1/.p1  ORF type:complete len:234 (+),score=23.99 gb/GECG01014192.1/:1-702(+)
MPPRTRRMSRKCSPATFLQGLRRELALPQTLSKETHAHTDTSWPESGPSSCSIRLSSEGRLSDEQIAWELHASGELSFTPGITDYDSPCDEEQQEDVERHAMDIYDVRFVQQVVTQDMIRRVGPPPRPTRGASSRSQFEWAKMLALESIQQLRLYCQTHKRDAKNHGMDLAWLESVSDRFVSVLKQDQLEFQDHPWTVDNYTPGQMDQLYLVSFLAGTPKSIAHFLGSVFEIF